jgi:hypothetical protein
MTIDEIKKNLPTVKVKLTSGIIVLGRVSGRKLDYPKVVVPTYGVHYPIKVEPMAWEFSWQAIERAINTDTALIV